MKYSILTLFWAVIQAQGAPSTSQELQDWMQRSNAVYSLHEAAAAGNVEVIEARLKEGADVNLADEQGDTPLHLAAKRNDAAAIKTLLEAGADKTKTDKQGNTAAAYATGDCAELLK